MHTVHILVKVAHISSSSSFLIESHCGPASTWVCWCVSTAAVCTAASVFRCRMRCWADWVVVNLGELVIVLTSCSPPAVVSEPTAMDVWATVFYSASWQSVHLIGKQSAQLRHGRMGRLPAKHDAVLGQRGTSSIALMTRISLITIKTPVILIAPITLAVLIILMAILIMPAIRWLLNRNNPYTCSAATLYSKGEGQSMFQNYGTKFNITLLLLSSKPFFAILIWQSSWYVLNGSSLKSHKRIVFFLSTTDPYIFRIFPWTTLQSISVTIRLAVTASTFLCTGSTPLAQKEKIISRASIWIELFWPRWTECLSCHAWGVSAVLYWGLSTCQGLIICHLFKRA